VDAKVKTHESEFKTFTKDAEITMGFFDLIGFIMFAFHAKAHFLVFNSTITFIARCTRAMLGNEDSSHERKSAS